MRITMQVLACERMAAPRIAKFSGTTAEFTMILPSAQPEINAVQKDDGSITLTFVRFPSTAFQRYKNLLQTG